MLSYSVKLNDDNIIRNELVWGEKYLAPDRSFVSGVTDQSYHLEKNDLISFSVGNGTNSSVLAISCENVTRNGYITIKDKAYLTNTGSTVNCTIDEAIQYTYVEINGVIYYIKEGDTSITIKNWLKEEWSENNGEYSVKIVEGDVTATVSGDMKKVFLDTIVWIEDETAVIDGNRYYFDRYDVSGDGMSPGGLKYYKDGRCLSPNELTETKDNVIYYNHFKKSSQYQYVTKFTLTQKDNRELAFDDITFCTYFYYVKYKDVSCQVRLGDGNTYVCDVPKRLFTENISDSEYYSTSAVTLYYEKDIDVEFPVTTDVVDRITHLNKVEAYIKIEGAKLPVERILQNSNGSDRIAIYLTDSDVNVSVGDVVTLENETYNSYASGLYHVSGETFVLYNNTKYKVEERLCDKVSINGHEYPIEYANGIADGNDAFVDIMGEKVPMKINGDKLDRYGLIISDSSNAAVSASYDIVKYDGVDIDGKKYQVVSGESEDSDIVTIEEKVPFQFYIESIEGSSLLVCEPNFSIYEFDDEFRKSVNKSICDYFVTNKPTTSLYVRDSSFGPRNISSSIGFLGGMNDPSSSNDFYNLFDNLVLYTNSGYIGIPIKLETCMATNIIQGDIVEKQFYEEEKKKAINGIVDMEKDVYTPKYMPDGPYSGSTTVFSPVSEIEVNLHFRTRDPNSWKVYDGYNNVDASGHSDNWFVTDYYPYSAYTTDSTSGEVLNSTSDLMGLLYFTNDDIYYQKDKVSKSFLRFSYYDSTDPQTQSLLGTSTVFVDIHKLFKKFIDNSRKNVNDYGVIEPRPEGSEEGEDLKLNMAVNNKISVMTEYLCSHSKKRSPKNKYLPEEVDASALEDDSRRISSRFIINNKYETTSSSDGFYLYMFKEYSENLHPKPIYMKVEFNHAGVGRTIPFVIPMHWEPSTTYTNNGTNIFSPERPLTLGSPDDIMEMKSGYTLSYVYAQTYIPLYAVYDFINKEYAYVFDERYIKRPSETGGRVILNMFELKIANEDTYTEGELDDITMGRPARAAININEEQFNKVHFK